MSATSVRGGAIWWTLMKVWQTWCNLQVKLCDPCLSALRLCIVQMALYKHSSFPFPWKNLGPQSNIWFPKPTWVSPQMASQSVQMFFTQYISVTNRQTDTQTMLHATPAAIDCILSTACIWYSIIMHKHGTIFLPMSLHQLLYHLSRDNLKHFYLPNLSHHFKLLSHICVPCPRSYLQ